MAAVGLDQTHYDVQLLIGDEIARNLQHAVRLADARCEAEKDLQFAATRTHFLVLESSEKGVRVGSLGFFTHLMRVWRRAGSDAPAQASLYTHPPASSARFRSNTFTRGSPSI